MNTEFDLGLAALNRSRGALDLSEHVALWKDKAPVAFTTKKKAVPGGVKLADASKHGITPEAVGELVKERADYDGIMNEPGVAQSVRRVLSKGFRPAFAVVEKARMAAAAKRESCRVGKIRMNPFS